MMTIFEYRCLDKIILGTTTRPPVAGKDQGRFDEQNCEAVMLIKLSIIDDQLPQVLFGKTTKEIWESLKPLTKAEHSFSRTCSSR